MVIPWAALYVSFSVWVLCALLFLISGNLQSAPFSPYSVQFKFQLTVFFLLLGLAVALSMVLVFGTAVPGGGYRIGW